ncbi:ABC transporter ATP-binding protein [Antarctobacter heliothermus]|uniref:Putative spermidine/putrescine transport system ATP-binding protein n=1 Tax=Antarctobacter heliothermus TaxID=74033 RepID=A0A239GG99_9RHOB|nr:ABC transporter ATP-binding protein [Antarctobacter heliothermus]SNS67782.1 putative spermidine/putrescine transport system ATP-binding protein [Antarctobacter heliothermus]
MSGLVLKSISKTFGGTRAVDLVNLSFAEGQLTALLGPSGCGKTTLLRMVAGLEAPSGGVILLGDRNITDLPAHRRKFGMVFQSFALFPHLTVRDNVAYSLHISGVSRSEAADRAGKLLDLVQLSAFGDRRIGQLSGGQRQRVAIARALAQEPEVFLLDEPMSALDAKLREEMQVELRLLQQRLGITTIVVTHDQREAMTMADSIVVMSNGRVEQVGSPQDIYHKPQNAFVADFIGKANFFDGMTVPGGIRIGATHLVAEPRFIGRSLVRVAIRPERACLDEEPGANRLPAKITFVRDLGPIREYHLESALGRMVVEYAAGEGGKIFQVGDTTEVRLPPDALHIFPAPTAHEALAVAAE